MKRSTQRTPIAPWTYLRYLRFDRGETLEEAAAGISLIRQISRAHLNHLEIGRVGPGEETLFALAEYYGVRASALAETRPPLPSRVGEFARLRANAAQRAATADAA